MPNFTYTRDIPNGPNNPSADQPIMQTNANSTDSILDVDLYGFNDNNGGYHQKSTYVVQGSDPVPVNTNGAQGIVYSKTVSGVAEIFVTRFGNATPIQLTKGGVSAASNGYSFLPGGILIQWGNVAANTTGVAFTYPIAFTTIFSLTGAIQALSPQDWCFVGVSNTGATAKTSSGAQNINWIAIGN